MYMYIHFWQQSIVQSGVNVCNALACVFLETSLCLKCQRVDASVRFKWVFQNTCARTAQTELGTDMDNDNYFHFYLILEMKRCWHAFAGAVS